MLNLTCKQIAEIIGGEIIGDSALIINSILPIEKAGLGSLSFYYHEKYENYFLNSKASCLIISDSNRSLPKPEQSYIRVENPYLSFVNLLKFIEAQSKKSSSGIHQTATVGEYCNVDSSSLVSANCVIGDNCSISQNVVLKPHVVLYDDVTIGDGTVVHSNVVIYQGTKIGKNCIIHAGAIIGADGFGFVENKQDGSYDKVPQLGNVIIEDNVEIGANSTIDRALIGNTIIRNGTKIDNLVHIAHNCDIGDNTGIAAQTGISGSVISGKRNRFGGQVGIAGHLEIPDDVTILAQSGVSKSIVKSGIYFGSPIKEHLKAFKIEAVLRKLPEMASELNDLRNKLKLITEKIGE